MRPEDYQREPCQCHACIVAGVANVPQRRDPWSGAWLHGKDLRRWYEAKQQFMQAWKTTKPKGMR